MPHPADDDLFKDSTMTFGEHLDELRGALFKSVLAIAVGFIIGLSFLGTWVVAEIKAPLEKALQKYQIENAVDSYIARSESRERDGEKVPPELKSREYVEKLIVGEQLLFEERFIDAGQVLSALKEKYPDLVKDVEIPQHDPTTPPKKSDMLRLFLWHLVPDDYRVQIIGLSPPEAFAIYVKASLVSGIVLASPGVFYFMWSFVAAGLYPHEKKYVHIFLPFSLGLFLAGVALAYFFVFPPVLEFFFSYNRLLGIEASPRISEWMSFVLILPLAFGVSFQLPLIMLFLHRIGIFTVEQFLSNWRVAILVIAIAAAVLTPTADPTTMIMLVIPLVFLFFGGILLCKWMPSGSSSERR